MDDTPQNFLHELKHSVLKKRVGLIALAVVLASALLQFISNITRLLVVPLMARFLRGHTETVLFENRTPFPTEALVGSTLEFVFSILAVFYLSRWLRGYKPPAESEDEIAVDPTLNVDLGSLASGPKREDNPAKVTGP